jgi:hypothetical protein
MHDVEIAPNCKTWKLAPTATILELTGFSNPRIVIMAASALNAPQNAAGIS